MPNLELFVEAMHRRIQELDSEGKRIALDMLGSTVYLGGENAEKSGVKSPENGAIAFTSSQRHYIPFSLKISAGL